MAMECKMPFSITNWSSQQITELGSVEETVWSLVPSFDIYGKGCVGIIRSRGNGNVKIDVRVYCQGISVLAINDSLLLDGIKKTGFMFSKNLFLCSITSAFEGYVTVHYNLKSTLSRKMEAGTQTENDIISSIAEATTQTENYIISSIAETTIPSSQLSNDLLQFLDNPDSFSDATLVCGTITIPVHRVILSARSPVFTAMFKTQMQESRDGVVDIVDMEPDVLQAMLRYVYSGQTDHFTNSLAGDLLFAADKYQLQELKLICVKVLKAGMAANNVFQYLVLGDLHDKSLKAHAVEFICKCTKFTDLEKSEEWQSLLKEHPYLAVEVLTTVVKCLEKKCDCAQKNTLTS